MDAIFAISDIHGEEEKARKLLNHWNPDREQLVLLGDLVDRGENSLGVILLAMELQQKYGAKVIGGNHDDMLLDWIDDPNGQLDMYYPQGGIQTINSFFDQNIAMRKLPEHIATLMKEQFPNELEFLRSLPNYYEQGKHVFVHAGVNLAYEDWKNTSDIDFRWIRHLFHYGRNDTGKVFVFGHTPTRNLNPDRSHNVWISPCQTKIGIDGGAVYGGLMHGLRINEDCEYDALSIDREFNVYRNKLSLRQPAMTIPF